MIEVLTAAEKLIKKISNEKIVVVMGGLSAEREISLLTGQAIVKALKAMKMNVRGLDIKNRQDLLRLATMKPSVVVNGLHGPGGEDGQIQGFLDWMCIPYTGSGVLASALAMDKHRAKQIMQEADLPTAPWVVQDPEQLALPKGLKLPVVIKPNRQGSAIGVSVVKKKAELKQAFEQARRYGDQVLIEAFCSGTEVSVGIIQGQALPVIEIVPKKAFYDYEAKYVAGMSDHIIPARLSKAMLTKLQKYAVQTAAVMGCHGTPRVDMIVSPKGKITILEINTLPGMTATSLLPESAGHAGITFEHLVLLLIEEAISSIR